MSWENTKAEIRSQKNQDRIAYEHEQAHEHRQHVQSVIAAAMQAINPALTRGLARTLARFAVTQYLDGHNEAMACTFALARGYTPMAEGDEA